MSPSINILRKLEANQIHAICAFNTALRFADEIGYADYESIRTARLLLKSLPPEMQNPADAPESLENYRGNLPFNRVLLNELIKRVNHVKRTNNDGKGFTVALAKRHQRALLAA